MAATTAHRFEFLVSRSFDIALAVSAAALGYFAHERETFTSPNDRLLPLAREHVLRVHPATFGRAWIASETALAAVAARLPRLPERKPLVGSDAATNGVTTSSSAEEDKELADMLSAVIASAAAADNNGVDDDARPSHHQ